MGKKVVWIVVMLFAIFSITGIAKASVLTEGDSEIDIQAWNGGVSWKYKGQVVLSGEYIRVIQDGVGELTKSPAETSFEKDGVVITRTEDGVWDYKKTIILTKDTLKIDIEVTLYPVKGKKRDFSEIMLFNPVVFKDAPYVVHDVGESTAKEGVIEIKSKQWVRQSMNIQDIKIKTDLAEFEMNFFGDGNWQCSSTVPWMSDEEQCLRFDYDYSFAEKITKKLGVEIKFTPNEKKK